MQLGTVQAFSSFWVAMSSDAASKTACHYERAASAHSCSTRSLSAQHSFTRSSASLSSRLAPALTRFPALSFTSFDSRSLIEARSSCRFLVFSLAWCRSLRWNIFWKHSDAKPDLKLSLVEEMVLLAHKESLSSRLAPALTRFPALSFTSFDSRSLIEARSSCRFLVFSLAWCRSLRWNIFWKHSDAKPDLKLSLVEEMVLLAHKEASLMEANGASSLNELALSFSLLLQ